MTTDRDGRSLRSLEERSNSLTCSCHLQLVLVNSSEILFRKINKSKKKQKKDKLAEIVVESFGLVIIFQKTLLRNLPLLSLDKNRNDSIDTKHPIVPFVVCCLVAMHLVQPTAWLLWLKS